METIVTHALALLAGIALGGKLTIWAIRRSARETPEVN